VTLRQDGENTVSTPLETRHDHLWPGPAAIKALSHTMNTQICLVQ